MKKIIGLLIGLLILSGVAMAYSTHTYFVTGTVTPGAIVSSSLGNKVFNSVMVFNDNATSGQNIWLNLDGNLTTVAQMTTEATAFLLKAGEKIIVNDFRANRIKMLSSTGTVTYRIFGIY